MILRIDIEKESNLASKMYFKRVFHLSKFCYLRLFIILSFLFIANSSSKAQSYHKLFDHSSYFIEVPDQNAQVSYHWIFDFGDSIYNSKIYRKVYWGWNNTTLLIREDTILKIVYALSPGAILELPIYNFNVSVGSIFTTYSFLQGTFPYQFQVTLIDSIQINNGTYRKRIHATCNTPPCVSWWPFSYKYVEGIGSLDEPIGIFYDASDPEFYLKCFNQNLAPIYTAGAFICPPDTLSILGLGDNKEMSMNIYPNPASSKINISFAQPQKNIRIKLFNLFGQELQEFHQEMALKIELEFIFSFNKGIYLLDVQTDEGQIRRRIAIK